MNVNRKLLIAGFSAALLVAGASALAARGDHDHSERMLGKVSERLDLDEGQRAALGELHTEMQQMRDLMRGDRDGLMEQMQEMLALDSLDQSAALDMIEQRTEAVRTSAPELVNAAAVFLDGLSVEQKADIATFIEKRGARHHR